MRSNPESCKKLITAILGQALLDAQSSDRADEPEGARRFINKKNELFCHYCELIDLEPEYAARKMKEQITKKRGKDDDVMLRLQVPV